MKRRIPLSLIACAGVALSLLFAAQPLAAPAAPVTAAAPATPKAPGVGEQIPSEDALIKNLHSLGLINGQTNIFRSASPTRDLVKDKPIPADQTPLRQQAGVRMRELAKLGIKTIISLENPDAVEDGGADTKAQQTLWIALEKQAAQDAGLTFVSHPVVNSGPESLETMTDAQVMKLVDPIAAEIFADSRQGGVVFHCAAGHDRTGIVAAYIRIKYEQWPVQPAIDEMRRLGHNWVKYSNNGGMTSWHEEHLKAIAGQFKTPAN